MTEFRDGVWVETEKEGVSLQDKYRAVLLGPMGRDVLTDILAMCHFGSTLDFENKAQISEYNVGIAILAKCGIFLPDNFEDVVRALCSVQPMTGKRSSQPQ
jgi:hypothetical protein